MAFGVTAVSAIAGYAAVDAGLVMASTVVYAGIAATVVGMVTHNKSLTAIGSGLSLGGGVANLAGAGAAASVDNTVAPIDNSISAVNPTAGGAGIGAPGSAASDITNSVTNSANPLASISPQSNNLTQDAINSGINSGVNASPVASATPTDLTAGATPPATSSVGDPNASGILNSTPVGDPNAGNLVTQGATQIAGDGSAGATLASGGSSIDPGTSSQLLNDLGNAPDKASWFSSLTPAGKLMVGQIAAGSVGGLANMYTEQQKLALQKLQNTQQWQQYQTSIANANAVPSITYKNTGLINSKKP